MPKPSLLDVLINTGLSIFATAIALIPTWITLFVWHILHPQGFFQGLLTLGVAAWLLGAIQLILLAGLLVFLVAIWMPKARMYRKKM